MTTVYVAMYLHGHHAPLGAFSEYEKAVEACEKVLQAKRPGAVVVKNDSDQFHYADVEYIGGGLAPAFIYPLELDDDHEVQSYLAYYSRKTAKGA